jgi:carboxyl-terminal processing protease
MARRVWSAWLVFALMVAMASRPLAADVPKSAKEAAASPAGEKGKPDADAEYYELYKLLADTMSQVEQNYVKDVNRRELMEAAIRGVLDKLDPYSNYISPDELNRFKTSVDSQFGGIGIQITIVGGQLKVLSPLVGTPAYNAGIQAGDSIIEIEGKSTENISIDDAVRRLKGEAGTSVTLTVVHPRGGKRATLTIGREIIQLPTVLGDTRKGESWDFMLDHDKKIGYVRITAFSRDTARDLEDAVEQLEKQGLRGLVIDLRFNPGGLLKSATDISDLFISDGVIVTTKGRNLTPRTVTARKAGTHEGFPIAILVNHYSASASEIVSACLQDHKRAVIVGERTFGKGSVQNVIDLEDGRSALKLTTASYWRPSGRNIHRFPDSKESDEWGVMPDKGYEVKLSDSELSELMRVRRDRDIVQGKPPAADAPKDKDDGNKPADKAADKKATDKPAEKPAATKTSDQGKGESKDEKAAPEAPPSKPANKEAAESKPFVDRQLQKALDYLDGELARR